MLMVKCLCQRVLVKMEVQTKINAVIITMLLGFTTLVVIDDSGVELEPTHYCESKEIKMHCFRTTAMYCYPKENTRIGSKKCVEGWKEIVDAPISIRKSNALQFDCNHKDCIEKT